MSLEKSYQLYITMARTKRKSQTGTRGRQSASRRVSSNTTSLSKMVLIGAGVGTVAGTGYLAYNHFANKSLPDKATPAGRQSAGRQSAGRQSALLPAASSGPSTSGLQEPPVTIAFPLSPGDKNLWVQRMQQALIKHGGKAAELIKSSGGADGVFGEGTRQALFDAGFENQMSNLFMGGTKVTFEEYSKIIEASKGLGALDQSQLAKLAYSTAQTYMLHKDLLNNEDPRAFPVKANVLLGTLLNEKNGLSQILGRDGKIYYTNSSMIKAV